MLLQILSKMPNAVLRITHSQYKLHVMQNLSNLTKFYSISNNTSTQNEQRISNILSTSFPSAKSIDVRDISGGCGAMYEIFVEAPQFKGLSIIKQHRLITEALKEEIKDMHGLRINTSPA